MALKGAAVHENVASAHAYMYDVLPVLCAVLKFSRMKIPTQDKLQFVKKCLQVWHFSPCFIRKEEVILINFWICALA